MAISINDHLSLSSTIAVNSRRCKGAASCPHTYYTDSVLRKELGKQTLEGLLEQIMGTDAYRILEIMVVGWGGYCIFYGVLSFSLRSRSLCSTRIRRYGLTRVMVSLMVDFEAAFNPVSLVKTKFRDELTKALSRIDTLCADRNAMKGQIHQMSKTQLDINDRLIKLEQIWEYLEQHQKRSYKRRTQNKNKSRKPGSSLYSSGKEIFSARKKSSKKVEFADGDQDEDEKLYEDIRLTFNTNPEYDQPPNSKEEEGIYPSQESQWIELSSMSEKEDFYPNTVEMEPQSAASCPTPPPRPPKKTPD